MSVNVKRETLNVSTGFGNHIYLFVTSNFSIRCFKIRSRKPQALRFNEMD